MKCTLLTDKNASLQRLIIMSYQQICMFLITLKLNEKYLYYQSVSHFAFNSLMLPWILIRFPFTRNVNIYHRQVVQWFVVIYSTHPSSIKYQPGNVYDYFFRVTSLFIDNIKTVQKQYKCIACSDIQIIILNIYNLKYVLYYNFRLSILFCAIVIPQSETPVNVKFWNRPSCKQETKTTAPADVYKAWNPKGWQTLRKAQAYFLWYYASALL